jgi:hypothetical protein
MVVNEFHGHDPSYNELQQRLQVVSPATQILYQSQTMRDDIADEWNLESSGGSIAVLPFESNNEQ